MARERSDLMTNGPVCRESLPCTIYSSRSSRSRTSGCTPTTTRMRFAHQCSPPRISFDARVIPSRTIEGFGPRCRIPVNSHS